MRIARSSRGSGAVLVTGASSGLGRVCAERFEARGYQVIRWDIIPTARGLKVDVAREESVASAARSLPALAGVVNCAGITSRSSVIASDSAQWSRVIETNLIGTFLVAQATFSSLNRGRGVFVAIGSVQGSLVFPGRSAYGASKAGVLMLVKCLAAEWGEAGVRAVCVSPGYTDAGMAADVTLNPAVTDHIPSGNLVSADDVADVVEFAVSPSASAVNGVELLVDNGFSSLSGV